MVAKEYLTRRVNFANVKNDFIESKGALTWYIYIKNIDPASTLVEFTETTAQIRFRTSDAKFLQDHNLAHDDDNDETLFEWSVELTEQVDAKKCAFKVNKSTMEIRLCKSNPEKRWNAPFKSQQQQQERPTSNGGVTVTESGSVRQLAAASSSSYHLSHSVETPASSPSPTSSSSSTSPSSSPSFNNSSGFSFDLTKNESPVVAKSTNSVKPTTGPSSPKPAPPSQQVAAPEKPLSPYYGHTGLVNLGNTCYMNAALQCLVNTTDLRDYFLGSNKIFQKEINTNNALGLNGRMAVTFAIFLKQLWNSTTPSQAPSKLRELLCTKFPHFKGYEQQDTQELLFSLLSVLHEDLNRVVKKPFYESSLECEDDFTEHTNQIAQASWARFLAREDSVVVDNFFGQFKSKLTCPECGKISITFEPFNSLLVPLPKPKRQVDCILMFSIKRQKQPIRMKLVVSESDKVQDLCDQVVARFDILRSQNLKVFVLEQVAMSDKDERRLNGELGLGAFAFADKCLNSASLSPATALPSLGLGQVFFFNETELSQSADPVLELHVEQICKFPIQSIDYDCEKCSYCKKVTETELDGTAIVELRRCTRCYRSAYCSSECQKLDWPRHSRCVCVNAKPLDLIGMPFVFTTTRSELTSENGETNFRKTLAVLCSSAIEFTKENNFSENLASKFTIELAESFAPGSNTPLKSHPIGYQEIVEIFEKETATNKASAVQLKILVKWTNQIKQRTNFYPTMCTNLNKVAYLSPSSSSSSTPHFDSNSSKLVTNLDDCLNLFTKPEKLTQDNPWYCSNCKKHQEATKQMHIWRLPKYLIVTLKRFQANKASDSIPAAWQCDEATRMFHSRFSQFLQNRVVYNKLNNHVNFPIRGLEMSKYVNDPDGKHKPHVYDLYGVINHIGTSLYSGHYTSFARTHSSADSTRDELGWRLFDDSHVTKIKSEDAVQTSDAYVLFYRLRTDDSSVENEASEFLSEATVPKTASCSGTAASREPADESEPETSRLYQNPGASTTKFLNQVAEKPESGDDFLVEDILNDEDSDEYEDADDEKQTNDSDDDMECSADYTNLNETD